MASRSHRHPKVGAGRARGGVFIVVREGDEQSRVYYFHHEDGAPSAEFTSFREALQYLIAQPNLP